MRKYTTIFLLILSLTGFGQTANDQNSYLPYSGKYGYGLNPGWYGFNWSTQNIIDLGAGNNSVKGLGAHSFRMQIYDNYMGWYGDSSLLPDYEHLAAIGAAETAVMVGGPRDANVWDTAYYIDATDQWKSYKAKVFKGMYEPIFLQDGSVNPANTYAYYLYKVVKIYGKYIKFYEIWNEPDYTYGNGGWLGDTDPPNPISWFYKDPSPEDLVNLRVPTEYYIRMLRISWTIIKKYQPNAYVCTGGIGNRSFLSVLLRKTDNPDGGKVTPEYPFNGAAYFDVLSFHTYPEFYLRHWANPPEVQTYTDGFVYERTTDFAVKYHLRVKNWMDSMLKVAGYNGVIYPAKQFICTETGMSRQTDESQFGGNEVQKNYVIKTHVKTQMDGQIKQTYWYSTGDGANADVNHWDAYGLYKYFGGTTPWNAQLADQGIALKTLSDLLYGATYDHAKTVSLKLPSIVDGGAFKKSNGSYIYVLWAKATLDLSENATATVSLPACIRKEWNYSVTGATSSASGSVSLNGTPSFFEPTQALPINDVPNQGPPTIRKWYNVEVMDITGRLIIKRQDVELQQLRRDLHNSRLSSGAYIIKYHNGKEAGVEKYQKL